MAMTHKVTNCYWIFMWSKIVSTWQARLATILKKGGGEPHLCSLSEALEIGDTSRPSVFLIITDMNIVSLRWPRVTIT